MTSILRAPRLAALMAIAVLVASASAVSFAESYRGLFLWAHEHGLSGPWAIAWPLQVDTFIAVGELALFVALADRWAPRSRAAAWSVTLLGLAVSVAGNVGHIAGRSLANHATAAVPPLAAAAALAVGLGVLKRVVERHHQTAGQPALTTVAGSAEEAARLAFTASVGASNPISERALADRFGIGRARARAIRQSVLAESNGHRPPDTASDARPIAAGQRDGKLRGVTS